MLLLLSCLVGVNLWNGHDHFALLCWTSACFSLYFTVRLLVLRLVSVAVLWLLCLLLAVLFLPAVGCALVLPVVGYALLPAVGFALLPAVGFALLPAVGFALLPAVGFALFGSFHPFSPARR